MLYPVGNSGCVVVDIEAGWLVLDVGCGHSPHPRADVLSDRYLSSDIERSGKPIVLDGRPFLVADADSLPFANRAFDYVIASHIAEHARSPASVCEELARVAVRGYIETPSKLGEMLLPEPFHRWYVFMRDGTLTFERITNRPAFGILGSIFYAVFYANIERIGHRTLVIRNTLVRDLVNRIVFRFLRRPWGILHRITYTCLKWTGQIRYAVVHDRETD